MENQFVPYEIALSLKEINMKESIITFKTAKLAKEKGFEENIATPTQALLQKWLREKHDIFVVVSPHIYNSSVVLMLTVNQVISAEEFPHNYARVHTGTYEEAFEEGLQVALKFLKSIQKDTPVARVGTVFTLKHAPERYYAIVVTDNVVKILNLNNGTFWGKSIVPKDNNKIYYSELEDLLSSSLTIKDLIILPEPEEIIELLKQ